MEPGDQLHAPAALPLAKHPRTHSTGGFMDPRAGVDGLSKRYVWDEIATDASTDQTPEFVGASLA